VGVLLVTGGSRTLGRPLVARLRQDGHDVRVLSRRASGGTYVGDGVAAAASGTDVARGAMRWAEYVAQVAP
jgi:nucleoside-diphosphate-sugar epimerase